MNEKINSNSEKFTNKKTNTPLSSSSNWPNTSNNFTITCYQNSVYVTTNSTSNSFFCNKFNLSTSLPHINSSNIDCFNSNQTLDFLNQNVYSKNFFDTHQSSKPKLMTTTLTTHLNELTFPYHLPSDPINKFSTLNNNHKIMESNSEPICSQLNNKCNEINNLYFLDEEILNQENMLVNEKLNYIVNSIRTYWCPELQKEQQLRKEEEMRINNLQIKLSQQTSEIQTIKNELKKREQDIEKLLAESDLGEMEKELRFLKTQFNTANVLKSNIEPRNFTDKLPTLHEFHTAKTKMERSEVELSEKKKDLQTCEKRLKCVEEQSGELEKRNEILTRENSIYETQLKLLDDDFNVLRKKLETKNQIIENRELAIKNLEKKLESFKSQFQDQMRSLQESELQINQFTFRISQLETLMKKKDAIADLLKQRLLQSSDTQSEAMLQQRLENLEQDKNNLEKTIDLLCQTSESEKQNQLQIFQQETLELRSTIEHLQKELADRHVLIVSQNEKISQFYSNQLVETEKNTKEVSKNELEEACDEVGKLLQIVYQLEKEKSLLSARLNNVYSNDDGNYVSNNKNLTQNLKAPYEENFFDEVIQSNHMFSNNEICNLKLRIEALEEALRESVGITSERDRVINEQKLLIQQLSTQVIDLYKNCGGEELQKTLKNALLRAETTENILQNERIKFQNQISNLRKEIVMAIINEKEACIQLLQSSPDVIKSKIEQSIKQKDFLKNRLLMTNELLDTTCKKDNLCIDLCKDLTKNFCRSGIGNSNSLWDSNNQLMLHTPQNQLLKSQLINCLYNPPNTLVTMSNLPPPPPYTSMAPIHVSVPPLNLSTVNFSAPASLNYIKNDNFEDDGIWA